ncbi:hypothetical protein CEXT_645861 [Caerostris extrusa]|uniref:Uncharacterized protein n=1 Tax=Caerostris extrusa TaxID=172846 RepID=A0AAV4MGG9_CAEEX|nr:hypothetical protein CEXT_645861 [Caerostris extrusa]
MSSLCLGRNKKQPSCMSSLFRKSEISGFDRDENSRISGSDEPLPRDLASGNSTLSSGPSIRSDQIVICNRHRSDGLILKAMTEP